MKHYTHFNIFPSVCGGITVVLMCGSGEAKLN